MELELNNGDYVLCGGGGFKRLLDKEAVLGRVLFKLTARRGKFPLMPGLGSELWRLPGYSGSKRERMALTAVTEALAGEPVELQSISMEEDQNGLNIRVSLKYNSEELLAEVMVV